MSNKPLMEKRRRARINNYLSQLREIVLKTLCRREGHATAEGGRAQAHDPRTCDARACEETASRYSKLEKADLLELTVNCLKQYNAARTAAAAAAAAAVAPVLVGPLSPPASVLGATSVASATAAPPPPPPPSLPPPPLISDSEMLANYYIGFAEGIQVVDKFLEAQVRRGKNKAVYAAK